MLRVTSGGNAQQLAASLAQVLADPMPDPMAPEWIVVTTAGVQRWLGLELARRLGTSGPDRSDGVAANLDMLFPGTLTRRVLAPDTDELIVCSNGRGCSVVVSLGGGLAIPSTEVYGIVQCQYTNLNA